MSEVLKTEEEKQLIQEILEKAGRLVVENTAFGTSEGEPYCALGLIDQNGYPTVSTITPAKAEGLRWITFCTGLGSNKANRIANSNRASVCINTKGAYNITLVGTIQVVTDPDVKRENWYKGMENHFSSPEDPDYCVLRFQTERYSLYVDRQSMEGPL